MQPTKMVALPNMQHNLKEYMKHVYKTNVIHPIIFHALHIIN